MHSHLLYFGRTERVLNGHRRAVNRICWHTTDWNLLLSGSQDGTIKLWVCRIHLSPHLCETYTPCILSQTTCDHAHRVVGQARESGQHVPAQVGERARRALQSVSVQQICSRL